METLIRKPRLYSIIVHVTMLKRRDMEFFWLVHSEAYAGLPQISKKEHLAK